MGQVDLLFRLQQIDDEIRSDKKRLGEVVRRQTESDELLVARRRAERAESELQTKRTLRTDLNLELNTLLSKVKRSEDRLYSGTVKNPKELSDLQQELDSLGRRREVLEDEVLEAMINLEEAQEEESEASESLSAIEADWEESQQNLAKEQDELVRHINELTAMRKQQLELVTPKSLALYENTVRRVSLMAVVNLRNGRCAGCQVSVPSNLIKAVDEGELVHCDSCGRILCPV